MHDISNLRHIATNLPFEFESRCRTRPSLTNAPPLQDPRELASFIDLLRAENVMLYGEIGVLYGGTFEAVMMNLPVGAAGVAVDFPGSATGDSESLPIFLAAVERIRWSGRQAGYVMGPSQAFEVTSRVTAMVSGGPFDCMLIDAGHSLGAVMNDWEHWHWLSRIIALHDIDAPEGHTDRDGSVIETAEAWRCIKDMHPNNRTVEIVTVGSKMGIGVMWMA